MTDKRAQFDEFFSINHHFNINVKVIKPDEVPSYAQFLEMMPMPFRMASEANSIDQAAIRPLKSLSGVAVQLADYLQYQSQKIDMLVGYILHLQDDVSFRFKGLSFGGGGIEFTSEQPFNAGDFIELKLFIDDSHCSIFCIGEIIDVAKEQNPDDEQEMAMFRHKVIFHHLREEDQELLVRASLHEQSKQLQQLAKTRQQKY